MLEGMSSPDDALSNITQQLQIAISANDRGPVFQLLPDLLQSLPVSPRQRHVPAAKGQQLLQLGAQALNLSTGNLQVCHRASVSNPLYVTSDGQHFVSVGSAIWLSSPQSGQSGHHWLARS